MKDAGRTARANEAESRELHDARKNDGSDECGGDSRSRPNAPIWKRSIRTSLSRFLRICAAISEKPRQPLQHPPAQLKKPAPTPTQPVIKVQNNT